MSGLKFGRVTGAALVTIGLALASPALAVDSGGNGGGSNGGGMSVAAPTAPSMAAARADIAAKRWTDAIAKLKLIVAANPGNADAYNLLGYSFRNAGNYDRAMQAYVKALKLDPKHAGALEYQGVLFLKLGQVDKAAANLAKIETICGKSCEEYKDLKIAMGS